MAKNTHVSVNEPVAVTFKDLDLKAWDDLADDDKDAVLKFIKANWDKLAPLV